MKPVPRLPTAKADAPLVRITEEAAAQAMWQFYRAHKAQLLTDIRDYRADILSQLMAGLPADDVFAPYYKPSETTRTLRRAA